MLRHDPRFPDGDRLGAYIYLTLSACIVVFACGYRLVTGNWTAELASNNPPDSAPAPAPASSPCDTTYILKYPGGPMVRAENPCWKSPLIFDKRASDELDRTKLAPAATPTPTPLPDVERQPDLYIDSNPRKVM